MKLFKFEYTTNTHDFTAYIIAESAEVAINIIENQYGFEKIKSMEEFEISSSPMVVCNSGWRKGIFS
jgi:hypothetical protein